MTSVLGVYTPAEPFTKFFNIETLCYSDNQVDGDVPVPFSVTNGVLDIVPTTSDVQDLIDNGYPYNRHATAKCALMGGSTKISSLGDNFKTWVTNYANNYGNYSIDGGSPINIVIAPTMVKVQLRGADYNSDPLYYSDTINSHDVLPSGDEYIMAGTVAGNYFSTWVFETPITVSYMANGTLTYLTLNSVFNYAS